MNLKHVVSSSGNLAKNIGSSTADFAKDIGGRSADIARSIGLRRALIGLAIAGVATGAAFAIVYFVRQRRAEMSPGMGDGGRVRRGAKQKPQNAQSVPH